MGRTRGVRRKAGSISVSVAEDDGTQVERDPNKKGAKSKGGRSTASRRNKGAAAGRAAMRTFCLGAIKLGVQGLCDQFNKIKAETQNPGGKARAAFEANADKNRYKDVTCLDETRVVLKWPTDTTSDYIHANWVDGAEQQKKYICTQGPKENTIDDFWRMIWQERCKSILMLCNETECGKKKCEKYWPDASAASMTTSHKLAVKFLKTEEIEKNLIVTKIEVSTEGEKALVVEHIQWRDWPDRGVPETSLSAFRLLVRVHKLTPIVVHCSAGIGRTGTLVGIDVLYSRLDKGNECTLEKVVREMRDVRHGAVQTDVQYVYMHRIVMAVAEYKRAVKKEEMEAFNTEYEKMLKDRGFI